MPANGSRLQMEAVATMIAAIDDASEPGALDSDARAIIDSLRPDDAGACCAALLRWDGAWAGAPARRERLSLASYAAISHGIALRPMIPTIMSAFTPHFDDAAGASEIQDELTLLAVLLARHASTGAEASGAARDTSRDDGLETILEPLLGVLTPSCAGCCLAMRTIRRVLVELPAPAADPATLAPLTRAILKALAAFALPPPAESLTLLACCAERLGPHLPEVDIHFIAQHALAGLHDPATRNDAVALLGVLSPMLRARSDRAHARQVVTWIADELRCLPPPLRRHPAVEQLSRHFADSAPAAPPADAPQPAREPTPDPAALALAPKPAVPPPVPLPTNRLRCEAAARARRICGAPRAAPPAKPRRGMAAHYAMAEQVRRDKQSFRGRARHDEVIIVAAGEPPRVTAPPLPALPPPSPAHSTQPHATTPAPTAPAPAGAPVPDASPEGSPAPTKPPASPAADIVPGAPAACELALAESTDAVLSQLRSRFVTDLRYAEHSAEPRARKALDMSSASTCHEAMRSALGELVAMRAKEIEQEHRAAAQQESARLLSAYQESVARMQSELVDSLAELGRATRRRAREDVDQLMRTGLPAIETILARPAPGPQDPHAPPPAPLLAPPAPHLVPGCHGAAEVARGGPGLAAGDSSGHVWRDIERLVGKPF